jgi:hypothetical protein
VVRAPT